ncbi:hypothetical protein ACHAW5_006450 [Stephanodiscus triporus]|uniref:Uncharacterized protein n=1 Tax=Stephanodiscus triporus TaxID=2934178 RepID=A0ABD3NU54_9STRA
MSERRQAEYRRIPCERRTNPVDPTTFAAAASPLSSPISTKKHKRTSRPDVPLLGVKGPSTKKPRLASFKVFPPEFPSKMFAMTSSGKKSLGKVQKNSITRILKKVSLKVKRGKFALLKPHQQEELPPGHVTSDDSCGSIADEVFVLDSTMDSMDTDTDDMSLSEVKKLNMDVRLTPLSFDDTQVTNHFTSSSGGEDFTLHKSLSPRVDSTNTSQEAHSLVPSLSLDDMLKITNFLSLDLEDFILEDFQSLPHDDNEVARHCEAVVDKDHQFHREEDENRGKFNDVLESVMNTPPRPEIRRKFNDVLEKVMSTPPQPAPTRCSLVSNPPPSPPFPQSSGDESGGVDLPETTQIDSPEGQEYLINEDQIRRSDSSDSIPSLSGGPNGRDQALTDNIIAAPISTNDAADSAIAWGCLAALLGSPAPSSARKQRKRIPVNLWQDDASLGEGLDSICLPQDDCELRNELRALNLNDDDLTASDDCSIPSCEDLVRDVGDSCNLDFPTTPSRLSSKKGIADSTLAWGVLGAILGSPVPSCVSKKSAAKKRGNLWDDGEEEDVLPEIEGHDDNQDESDFLSAPIDLTELVEADEQVIILAGESIESQEGDSGRESAESVLAWTALGMLLGSPAPKSVCKKSRKESEEAAKNLWKDNKGFGDDALDTVPFISPDEVDESIATECHLRAEKWLDGQDQESVPSLSRTPSLSESSDEEDSNFSSPVTRRLSKEYFKVHRAPQAKNDNF